MAGRGLFAVVGPPEEEDDLDDYGDDLAEPADEGAEDMGSAGPLDAYAETVFDPEADPASRTDALQQFVLTVLEQRGQLPKG